jgi:hypothetical protein
MGSSSTKEKVPIPKPDISLYPLDRSGGGKRFFFQMSICEGYELNTFAIKSINGKPELWNWKRSNGLPYRVIIWSHSLLTDNSRMFQYLQSVVNNLNNTAIILCYDYPGYAESKPKQFSFQNSIKALSCVVDFVLKYTTKENIYLIGHEFGAEVVVEYAYQVRWTEPIMLIGSRPSLMSESFNPPKNSGDYTSHQKLEQLECPVLIVQHRFFLEPYGLCDAQQTFVFLQKPLQPVWIDPYDPTKIDNISGKKIVDVNNILTEIDAIVYMNFISRSIPFVTFKSYDQKFVTAVQYDTSCKTIADSIARKNDFEIDFF